MRQYSTYSRQLYCQYTEGAGKMRQYSTYSRHLYCQHYVEPNDGSDVADDTVGLASVAVTLAFVLYGENSETIRGT